MTHPPRAHITCNPNGPGYLLSFQTTHHTDRTDPLLFRWPWHMVVELAATTVRIMRGRLL